MEIVIKAKALKTLSEVADYIDSLTTFGAGSRWLDRFLLRIEAYARPNVVYPLCKQSKLARRNLSCITYKNWVVAFKFHKGNFVIYEIIFGTILY